MQAVDSASPLCINEDVVYTEVEDEIVMMDLDDGAYHGLNPVGTELWKLLAVQPMSLEAMGMYLQEKYGIEEHTALTDASAFVSAMLKQNFLIFPAT